MKKVKSIVGISQKDNLIEAAREAALKAKEDLNGKTPKLLMFFCIFNVYPSSDFSKSLEEIYNVFGNDKIPLVGGTAPGIFANNKYYYDPSIFGKAVGNIIDAFGKFIPAFKVKGVILIALESEYLSIGAGIGENAIEDPQKAGRDCIKMALDNLEYNPSIANLAMSNKEEVLKFRPIDGFMISPGMSKNGYYVDTEILDAMMEETRRNIRLAGTGLCDEMFEGGVPSSGTVFYGKKAYKEGVATVVFGSELNIGYGTANGAKPVGPRAIITKAEGWTIKEINNRPAADVLAEIIENNTDIKKEKFLATPMYISVKGYFLGLPERREDFYWPLILVKINEDKSIISSLPVKEGMGISLIKINKEDIEKTTIDAAEAMKEDAQSQEFELVMFFSCALRIQMMGMKYFKEIENIKKRIKNKDAVVVGFASSGEQAFYKNGPMTGTNVTITMMGISNKLVADDK